MACFIGYLVSFFNGKARIHCHIDLGMKPVPKPSHADLRNTLHAFNVAYSVPDLLDYLGVYTIK